MNIEDVLSPKEFLSIDQDTRTQDEVFKKVNYAINLSKQTFAPNNSDPFRFIVVKSKTLKESIANATLKELILAKLIVVIDCNSKESELNGISKESAICNCGMALQNFIIYSRSLGLNPSLFFKFDETKFKEKMLLKNPLAIVFFGNITNKKQVKAEKKIVTLNDSKNTKENPLLESSKFDEYIKEGFKDTIVDLKSLKLGLKKNVKKFKEKFLNNFD